MPNTSQEKVLFCSPYRRFFTNSHLFSPSTRKSSQIVLLVGIFQNKYIFNLLIFSILCI
nr:MAG TPA: hypothetical protein [Caudoviricetes sp.]